MPGFNGRGPNNAGPMTGRGRGYCNPARAGYNPQLVYGRGFGFGYGRGPGYGRGFGRGYGRGYGVFAAGPAAGMNETLSDLKQQADFLQNSLNAVNQRIAALEPLSRTQEEA